MALHNELQNLGLSDKEASVYLAILELGQDSVQNIAKKAKVNRATTYTILDALVQKGLVSLSEQNNKTYYLANDPEALWGLLELKKREILEKERRVEQTLPSLRSIYNSKNAKPTIRYFEGMQGLLQAVDEFVPHKAETNEPIRLVYSKDKLDVFIDEKDKKKFSNKRQEYGIPAEVIYTYTKGDVEATKNSKRVRLDEKKYPISTDIEIYNDQVYISTLENDLSAILIKNASIAETLKTLFRLAQIGAETESKKKKNT